KRRRSSSTAIIARSRSHESRTPSGPHGRDRAGNGGGLLGAIRTSVRGRCRLVGHAVEWGHVERVAGLVHLPPSASRAFRRGVGHWKRFVFSTCNGDDVTRGRDAARPPFSLRTWLHAAWRAVRA